MGVLQVYEEVRSQPDVKCTAIGPQHTFQQAQLQHGDILLVQKVLTQVCNDRHAASPVSGRHLQIVSPCDQPSAQHLQDATLGRVHSNVHVGWHWVLQCIQSCTYADFLETCDGPSCD